MYEGYKFNNLRDIILYVIAKYRAPITYENICKELSDINERNIYSTLRKLEYEKLIKKFNRESLKKSLLGLNVRKIDKIKKELNEHWENHWEDEWNNAAKKRYV